MAGEASIPARLVTCRPDRCAGATHWLTFTVTVDARAALADARRPAFVEVEYREYRHHTIRRSLLADLESSERDRAA